MGGDYTRFTFKAKKNHSGVLKQQGRVSLDADWNELAEIGDRRWRSETMDIIGRCVVPETTPDAFLVIPTGSGTFDIGIGRSYVDGIQAECHGLDPREYDPILGEERGTLPVPYSDQPYYSAPLPPPLWTSPPDAIIGRTDLIYLDVWQREVTVIEDPDLKEIALGGPDTTTRVQTAWQVKALEDVGEVACPDTIPEWDALTRPSAGQLTTTTFVPSPDDRPCSIAAAGGYRGLENRLYRVEIHTPGDLGTAKFKWSRNNAAIVSSVTAISASADQITVDSIGRDDVLRFDVGDWVEITDDHLEFQGQPGHMGRITNIDEANRIITIDNTGLSALSLNPAEAERHTRIRRWDQRSGVDAEGLLTVPADTTELVDVEDGIQVSFNLNSDITDGEFKAGDYWVFHARTADGSVALLDNAPPRGIKHHYCRLALVTWGATVETTIVRDCRTIWPPAKCCPIAVRPGEDIQAAIDLVPADGGCVCMLPGIHRIYRPLFIDGRQNLTITGVGVATKVVFVPTGLADLPDLAMLYIFGGSRNIDVRDFLIHADSLQHLIFVDQASEGVAFHDLTMINATLRDHLHIFRMGETAADGILLGECCRIKTSGCRLLGMTGIVQADRDTLENARETLAALRPEPEVIEGDEINEDDVGMDDDVEEAEPVEVSTIKDLDIEDSEFFFTDIGVKLQDVLGGNMSQNHLRAVPSTDLDPFIRQLQQFDEPGEAALLQVEENFYLELDDKLAAFSPCPKPIEAEEGETGEASDEIPEDTIGAYACMIEAFRLLDNCITAGSGIVVEYSRCVRMAHNHMKYRRIGIALNYGFEAAIEDNAMRLTNPGELFDEEMEEDLWSVYRMRFHPGYLAVAMRFVRGAKVNDNTIDSHSAVGVWGLNWKLCSSMRKDTLLRIFRIEHPWRVIVELGWFFYQIFGLLSAATTGDWFNKAKADEAKTPKEAFEHKIFNFFAELINSRYIPYFIGKTEISGNRIQATRFGVYFRKIVSISGLRILGNRISGFRNTGILVHPWYSFGPVDVYARWTRCVITWFIAFIRMLRDALKDFLEGTEPSDQPEVDIAPGILGGMTQAISWILVLCSQYCRGNAQPEEEEPDEEPPPSPAEVLKDALDDFLDHVNLAWLDDLVNQSYRIDGNVLAGTGDGIYTGLDTSCITNNKITIWPQSSVPYETVVAGALLKRNFENLDTSVSTDYILTVADGMLELDRDLLFITSYFESRGEGLLKGYLEDPVFRAQFQTTLNSLLLVTDPSSALYEPLTGMKGELEETSPDLDKVQQDWNAVFTAMVHHLRGFGISMLGANMVCDENRVVSQTGCQNLFAGQKRVNTFANMDNTSITIMPGALPGGFQLNVNAPGIGGIWQFSNFFYLMIDVLLLIFTGKESKYRTYDLVMALIVAVTLMFIRERRMGVSENRVEEALAHGIRTLPVIGLSEVDIVDNFVKNASRIGIYHGSTYLGNLVDDLHLKIHRNTPKRARNASVFPFLKGLIADFEALILAVNDEGTTLMSNNHGDGEDLASELGRAIFVESETAGIIANHILTDAVRAFVVYADQGLFTDNMTNKPNNVSPAGIVEPPNIETL